jgi:hypothetical protein
MRLRIAPLTAAALVALGGVNVLLLAVMLRDEEVRAQHPLAEKVLSPALSTAKEVSAGHKPASSYAQTLTHPVFHKTRAPYVPPPPVPPPASATPGAAPAPIDPGIVLGGVAMDGSLKKAYLFSKGNPQGSWISEGETFLGWNVVSIDSGAARLKQADRVLELQLYPVR